MRIVLTGANRGIGLEFARQLTARGDTVDATARDPASATELQKLARDAQGRLRIHELDVADDASVLRFVQNLPAGPVDLLINNAGVMGKRQSLAELDLEDVLYSFDVNALGPLRVTRALLPRIRESNIRKVVHITSKMGSISDNTSGGAYGYRMSKVALNMANKSMALDFEPEGITFAVFNPGWVQTDMGGANAPLPVDQSVRNLLGIIDRLTPDDSGKFFNHSGEEVPW